MGDKLHFRSWVFEVFIVSSIFASNVTMAIIFCNFILDKGYIYVTRSIGLYFWHFNLERKKLRMSGLLM